MAICILLFVVVLHEQLFDCLCFIHHQFGGCFYFNDLVWFDTSADHLRQRPLLRHLLRIVLGLLRGLHVPLQPLPAVLCLLPAQPPLLIDPLDLLLLLREVLERVLRLVDGPRAPVVRRGLRRPLRTVLETPNAFLR